MVIDSIKVFARLKKEHELKEKSYDIVRRNPRYEDIVFHRGVLLESSANFRFCEIFDQNTDQANVFETVAKPVVSSVLQGFNGTIFAYGQTGSGKTYSMTGSTKKYQDRGIIPRSLQFIFSAIEKNEEKPTLYISYMEIYNEICYDLLNRKDSKTASRLEELPRVIVLEDKKGEPRLRNLSVLPVSTEEEAMRLLFLGDTNRAIAETPLNEYSSRSHCIFTIYITSRPRDSQTLRYSKLNLVDLAGSERVYKSHITGVLLNEAKHINLSLHFLQQVILALSESNRLHIPYRNSLMTFILKDSLAGNCLTVMLATLAVSRQNIQETISTCRFAQRVSLIKTEPVINEVSDPYQEILLLKNEIQDLRRQLAYRNTSALELENNSLTNLQREECEKKLEKYLSSEEDTFKIELDEKIIQCCFSIFKCKIQNLERQQFEVKQNKLKNSCFENPQNEKTMTPRGKNNSVPMSEQNESLLQEFMSNPKNSKEFNYYTKILSYTYEKAKIFALTIEECQRNINYIREKLVADKTGCLKQKMLLSGELEYQQSIYRNSLVELRELKQETMQLEAGLQNAKAKMLNKFNDWVMAKQSNHKVQFADNIRIDNGDCVSYCPGQLWDTDLDLEVNQNKLCQYNCHTCDQLDSLTYRLQSQYPNNDLPDITELSENNCQQSDGLRKPRRKKADIDFLTEVNGNRGLRSLKLDCTCNIGNKINWISRSDDTNNINKTTIVHTDDVRQKHSYEKADCKNKQCYSGPMAKSCKYLGGEKAQRYTNLETQSSQHCCFVPKCGRFKAVHSQHCQGHTSPLKVNNTVAMNYKNLEEETGVLSIEDDDVYSNIKTSNVSANLENYNTVTGILNCGSSMESLVYLDTQLFPNKLVEKSISKGHVDEITSGVSETITGISPNNQELSTIMEESVPKTTFQKVFKSSNRQEISSKVKPTTSEYKGITSTIKILPPNCQEVPRGNILSNLSNCTSLNNNKNNVSEIRKMDFKNTDAQLGPNKKYSIFLESDTEDFQNFMKKISLTGDEEIDKEICSFYRSKGCF